MKYKWKIRQIIEDNISPPLYASSPKKIPWIGQANQICPSAFIFRDPMSYFKEKQQTALHVD